MAANVDAMVRAGIEAYRDGKAPEARKLLEKAIELDDYNEQAWMWLSAVVDTEEEKRTCLENVIVINPENEEAQRGLKMLGVDGGASAPTAVPTENNTSNAFTDTGMADFGDVDFTADIGDDNEWSIPPTATSSASSNFVPPETSSGEYDDWVNNLGLGGDSSSPEPSPAPQQAPVSPDAFPAGVINDMFGLDDDDDVFGGDPFGSEDAFDDIDDTSYTSGPFGGDDSIDDDFSFDETPEPATPAPTNVVSPGAENLGGDSFFEDLDSADFAGGDFIVGDEAFDGDGQDDLTPDELFSFIPDEISATRLPGTKQGVPVPSVIVLFIMVLLNVGAIAFIASSL